MHLRRERALSLERGATWPPQLAAVCERAAPSGRRAGRSLACRSLCNRYFGISMRRTSPLSGGRL